jgi:hypothetical protein
MDGVSLALFCGHSNKRMKKRYPVESEFPL